MGMRTYVISKEYAKERAEREKYQQKGETWYWLSEEEKAERRKKMGEVTEEEIQAQMEKVDLGYSMTNEDKKHIEITKTKTLHNCRLCDKTIGSNMVLLGKGYSRFCPKCAIKFLPKVIEDLKEYIILAETSLKMMSEIDYAKWEEENSNKMILSSLKKEND